MQLEFMNMWQTMEHVRYRGVGTDFDDCYFVVTERTVQVLVCEF